MTNIIFYRITGDYDAAISEKINEELWGFKATAFLPHQIEESPSAPISISHHLDPGNHDALLINMSSHVTPDWFSRFRKVVEIVYDDAQVIEKKRQRYSFYQGRGYPIKYHDLTRTG